MKRKDHTDIALLQSMVRKMGLSFQLSADDPEVHFDIPNDHFIDKCIYGSILISKTMHAVIWRIVIELPEMNINKQFNHLLVAANAINRVTRQGTIWISLRHSSAVLSYVWPRTSPNVDFHALQAISISILRIVNIFAYQLYKIALGLTDQVDSAARNE